MGRTIAMHHKEVVITSLKGHIDIVSMTVVKKLQSNQCKKKIRHNSSPLRFTVYNIPLFRKVK